MTDVIEGPNLFLFVCLFFLIIVGLYLKKASHGSKQKKTILFFRFYQYVDVPMIHVEFEKLQ